MSFAHPSGFIVLGRLTTSKKQISSDQKRHTAVKGSQNTPTLHISISIWKCQGVFCCKPKWNSKIGCTLFSNWENVFTFFSYSNILCLTICDLHGFYFCYPFCPHNSICSYHLIVLIFIVNGMEALRLWECKWLARVTQVVNEVGTQTQVFWLQV